MGGTFIVELINILVVIYGDSLLEVFDATIGSDSPSDAGIWFIMSLILGF